jgi:serine-type D-Ala-D-Ala carboxypeptidase (penicillin-binding protein 5/6)
MSLMGTNLSLGKKSSIGYLRSFSFRLIILILALAFTSSLFLSDAFAGKIRSRAAVAMDAETGELLYSKNPCRQLPPASTTKLMTAIVTVENEDLTKIVTISKKASNARPSKLGLKEGDLITIENLLYATLLASANDAAVALAENVGGSEKSFVQLMNKRAMEIGAGDTKFINSTGLPGSGQHTTALDLTRILRCAMGYPKIKEIMETPTAQVSTEEGRTFFLESTDKLLWMNEKVIGGKTGYTCRARHCFVGAARDREKMIIVAILGSPSRKSLWKEAEKLIIKSFQDNGA